MSVGKIYNRHGFEYWYDRSMKVWYAQKTDGKGHLDIESESMNAHDRDTIEYYIDREVGKTEPHFMALGPRRSQGNGRTVGEALDNLRKSWPEDYNVEFNSIYSGGLIEVLKDSVPMSLDGNGMALGSSDMSTIPIQSWTLSLQMYDGKRG